MALPVPSPSSTCLVTGASSGIGAALARELASRGHNVTLAARRADRLESLGSEIADTHGVRAETVAADLTDGADRSRMVAEIAGRGLTVDVLVNNAGFGSSGRFQDLDPGNEQAMVDLNVVALHSLCAHFVAEMVARGRGAILNLSSTAGFQPLPRQATYAATKAFVLAFTEALQADLRGTGVSATALCPGFTDSEFWESGGMESDIRSVPGFAVMDAADVARAGVDGVVAGRRVVVPSAFNKMLAMSSQVTPHAILVPMMDRAYPFGK